MLARRLTLCLAAAAVLVACRDSNSAPRAADPGPTAPQAIAAPAAPVAPVAQGPVAITAVPQYGALLLESPDELNLLVRLEGAGEVAVTRPPLDLAIVIDRSGSMSGDKMRSVKQAALELLGRLRDDDRVTLISYSNDVAVHATRRPLDADGRGDLRNALLGLGAGGATALGPALFRALDILATADRPESHLAHVMLLSDGLANEGESRPHMIAARAADGFVRGVSVSTLGVGVDYNEDLMTRLADQGGGRYHFIRESQAVAGVLGDEMAGLMGTVARSLELELRPADGVRVLEVHGYPTSEHNGRTAVRVGALAAGQTREILLRLALPETSAKRLVLGQFEATFHDVAKDGAPGRVGVEASVDAATDAAAMRASEKAEVTVRLAEIESAKQLEIAARATADGDFAGATNSLQVAIGNLEAQQAKRPSPKLAAQIDDLKEAAGDVQKAQASESEQKAYTKKYKAKAYKSKKK